MPGNQSSHLAGDDMSKQKVLVSILGATALFACGSPDDPDSVINDQEVPGDQITGSEPERKRGCATVDHTDVEQAAINAEVESFMDKHGNQSFGTGPTINVWVHRIHPSSGGGNASNTQVSQQIAVLEAAYPGFHFV